MKRIAAPLVALSLIAAPLAAQDAPAEEDGFNLMEEGARLFLRGLMSEVEPALKDLEGMAQEMKPFLDDFAAEMGPALKDLMGQVQDWSAYHPPEMLPNGDIILRKKTEQELADEIPEGGEIEL
ncbi:hypothetical protein [Tropicibacter oceani]|uniref:AAA+ family ATPase n=1 Tax=Tropicibacter oceani TaxID=3058420 RepID=A0ABY8QCB6_9RHOB|nr:hypothetical protein [Tropicibacter oceani]WGW02255.1 hypothetical protein QF118_09820 [Tropicibacter oceani]